MISNINDDVEESVVNVTNVLYDCMKNAKYRSSEPNICTNQDRLQRLLGDERGDEICSKVERTIRKTTNTSNKPTDLKFKTLFESSSSFFYGQLGDIQTDVIFSHFGQLYNAR